jgi:hypothetical protein
MMTEIPEMSRALSNNTLAIARQYPDIHTFPGPPCHLNQMPQIVGAIAEASKLLCMGSAMKSKRLSIGPF